VRTCAAKISGGLSEEVSKVISSSFAEAVSNLSTGAESSSSIAGAVFASGTINRSRDDAGVDACATEISGEVMRASVRIGAVSSTDAESKMSETRSTSTSEVLSVSGAHWNNR